MNKTQQKLLDDICTRLSLIQSELQEVLDDEQAALENKSDKWLESEKGERAQEIVAQLEQAITAVESAQDDIAGTIA